MCIELSVYFFMVLYPSLLLLYLPFLIYSLFYLVSLQCIYSGDKDEVIVAFGKCKLKVKYDLQLNSHLLHPLIMVLSRGVLINLTILQLFEN